MRNLAGTSKNASVSLFARDGQEDVAVYKKCLQRNNDAIFG